MKTDRVPTVCTVRTFSCLKKNFFLIYQFHWSIKGKSTSAYHVLHTFLSSSPKIIYIRNVQLIKE